MITISRLILLSLATALASANGNTAEKLSDTPNAISAAAKTDINAAKRIADEFAETVKGVTPTQINAGQSGSNPNLELWRKGTQDVLSYQNWGTHTYTRNPNDVLVAAGVNLTGLSVPSWIDGLNQQQLYATAVSPLHIVSAAHWHPTVGQDLYFLDAANHSLARQVVSAQQITDPKGGITDLWVALLSSPLPPGIQPFKVLPPNYKSILTDITSGIPAWICQGGLTSASNLWTAIDVNDATPYQPNPSKGFDINLTRHNGAYADWNTKIIGGSGSPIFIVLNKQPVLISTLHYMNGTALLGGPSIADLREPINQAMAALQGGKSPYQLSEIVF